MIYLIYNNISDVVLNFVSDLIKTLIKNMSSLSENKSKSKRPNQLYTNMFRKVSVSSTNEAKQSKPKELSIESESEASTSSTKSLISTPQNLPANPDIAKLNDQEFHEKGIKMKILTCRWDNFTLLIFRLGKYLV